jgi:hypothetical protein
MLYITAYLCRIDGPKIDASEISEAGKQVISDPEATSIQPRLLESGHYADKNQDVARPTRQVKSQVAVVAAWKPVRVSQRRGSMYYVHIHLPKWLSLKFSCASG